MNVFIAALLLIVCVYQVHCDENLPPLIVAHRGLSEYRPEHSIASYTSASAAGADVIECDVTLTKDSVPMCCHSLDLAEVTDVAEMSEFADRYKNHTLYGITMAGYFISDFTLKEIRLLRLKQRFPMFRNTLFDDLYHMPTMGDFIKLAVAQRNEMLPTHLNVPNASTKDDDGSDGGTIANNGAIDATFTRVMAQRVGIMIESKYPSFFRSLGQDIEAIMISELEKYDLDNFPLNLYVESFEETSLRTFYAHDPNLKLIQLIGHIGEEQLEGRPGSALYDEMLTEHGLKRIAEYAIGVGVTKEWIFSDTMPQIPPIASDVITRAHALNIQVFAWTLRLEERYYAPYGFDSFEREVRAYAQVNVDGVFTDSADVCVQLYWPVELDETTAHTVHDGVNPWLVLFVLVLIAFVVLIGAYLRLHLIHKNSSAVLKRRADEESILLAD